MAFKPIEEIMRDLHPVARNAFRGLSRDLQTAYEHGQLDREIRPAQGFTTPREQQVLCDQRPVVDHRPPWFSPHQYGLAVEYKRVRPGWQTFEDKPLSGHDQEAFRSYCRRWGLIPDPNYDAVAVDMAWFDRFKPVLPKP